MGRISKDKSLLGNVFIWEESVVVGGSWDIGLINASANTKVAKLIKIKGQDSCFYPFNVTYYKNATMGGTIRDPLNTNLSNSAAANTVVCRAGGAAMTGGSVIQMVDYFSAGASIDGTLLAHEDLSIEIPEGQGFCARFVPVGTGGTIITGFTWTER